MRSSRSWFDARARGSKIPHYLLKMHGERCKSGPEDRKALSMRTVHDPALRTELRPFLAHRSRPFLAEGKDTQIQLCPLHEIWLNKLCGQILQSLPLTMGRIRHLKMKERSDTPLRFSLLEKRTLRAKPFLLKHKTKFAFFETTF